MAQLAVSAGGAALGFALGGPLGAQIGWAAGSLVGAKLFPGDTGAVPSVGDLRAPTVQYGSPLVRLYGSNRTAGVIAWYSAKRVIAGDSGGKGAPDAPTADTAEIDLLYIVGVDSEAVGIARVWRNGELIWTNHAASDDESLEVSGETTAWASIEFLDGNAAQLPHPVIEAAEGVGNVPAYRHRQCVLIDSLQLGQSGQIPLLEFEVIGAGTVTDSDSNTVQFADDVAVTNYLPTPSLRPWGAIAFGTPTRVPTFSEDDTTDSLEACIVCWDVDADGNAVAVSSDAIPDGYGRTPGIGHGTRALCAIASRSILPITVALVGDGASAEYALPDIDGYLGTDELRFATWGYTVAIATALELDAVPDDITGSYLGNRGSIYIANANGDHIATIEAALGEIESLALNVSTVWALSGGSIYPFDLTTLDGSASFACAGSAIFVDTSGALCYVDGASVYRRDGSSWDLLATMTGGVDDSTHRFGATPVAIYAACGDTVTETIPRYTVRAFVGHWPSRDAAVRAYGDYWFNSFTHAGGQRETRLERVDVVEIAPGVGASRSWIASYSCERLYGYPGDTSGIFDDPLEDWIWSPASTFVYIDESTATYATDRYYHDLFRHPTLSSIDPETVDLADIVRAEWGLVDDVANIDASDLEGIPVRGFQAAGSIRAALEMLSAVYHFGAVCSDLLYFRLRGGSTVATISVDELAAGSEGPAEEPFAPETANDDEIPERIALTYPNISDDYANGTETGYRGSGSTIVLAQQTNVVMTPSEAKKAAETYAAQAGIAATTARITLTDYYAALEPTDPILVPDQDGTTYRMRIARDTYGGGIHELDLVRDDVSALVGLGITDEDYTPSLTVEPPAETELVLLDTAILRDDDDDPGFYAAARGSDAGARLYSSADGVTYSLEVEFAAQAVFGPCAGVLADWDGGRVFDESSTLVVDVGDGELSSASRASLLLDETINACAIGTDGRWELCQFRSAALVSPGVYLLSGFLRGARGTEWASSGHGSGETFVLLTTSALRRVAVQTSEVGSEMQYKGVSVGRLLSTADAQAFTDNAIGQKCYAPAAVRVERDAGTNDATITWTRRTRKSTRFASPAGISCPLGEVSESYQVAVYADDTFASVVRTISTTSATASYSAAEQTADGLTPGDPISVRIYQINEIIGRGYAAEETA